MSEAKSKSREWADRYASTISAGRYAELGDLFASHCEYVNTAAKRELHDPAQIVAFYRSFLTEKRPTLRVCSFFENEDEFAFGLEAKIVGRDNFVLAGFDLVKLDGDGRASRFIVFFRGSFENGE